MSSPDRPEESSSALEEPSAAEEEDGLILWMLSLTPTQRLEVAQGFIDSIQALRNGRRS
jgi:hypothetical protein